MKVLSPVSVSVSGFSTKPFYMSTKFSNGKGLPLKSTVVLRLFENAPATEKEPLLFPALFSARCLSKRLELQLHLSAAVES